MKLLERERWNVKPYTVRSWAELQAALIWCENNFDLFDLQNAITWWLCLRCPHRYQGQVEEVFLRSVVVDRFLLSESSLRERAVILFLDSSTYSADANYLIKPTLINFATQTTKIEKISTRLLNFEKLSSWALYPSFLIPIKPASEGV